MQRQSVCFFVMPFKPELNYFYLYVKKYLEEKHGLKVERGDTAILTKTLMEKIREQIVRADIIIGDITSKNPNVFYELGLAHAFGKPIIFLTQDPPEQAPVDIRQFEFIVYDLGKHDEFLSKLDNAIQNMFVETYKELYTKALELLKTFNLDNKSNYSAANIEEFQARVMRGEQAEGIPPLDKEDLIANFLMPKILQNATDINIMKQLTEWLTNKYSSIE